MNYRIAEIMAGEDLGAAGTEIVDINLRDPISRIVIRFRPVGGSVTPAGHPVDAISKLEVVDGSDTLFSLKGHTAHALNIIEALKPALTYIHYADGGTPMIDVNLDFGRFLYDPELALDPTKFRNLQLKLTWDEDVWDASCDSHEFSMVAHVFDEKVISPVGFLMTKEHKSYAPSANAYEYTDLPTDYPLRKLLLQGRKYGNPPRVLINAIKLSEDNDKRIPIDGNTYDLEPVLRLFGGECEDFLKGQAATPSTVFYVTPSYLIYLAGIGTDDARYFGTINNGGGRINLIPDTTTKNFEAVVRGIFPHGVIPLVFGDQRDIDDWYDITRLGSLRLRIKAGGGAAGTDTVNVATQQLRRY